MNRVTNKIFAFALTDKELEEAYFINDSLVQLICSAKPLVKLESSNPKVQTLFLNDPEMSQTS